MRAASAAPARFTFRESIRPPLLDRLTMGMQSTRRHFMALLGAAPVAGKSALRDVVERTAGMPINPGAVLAGVPQTLGQEAPGLLSLGKVLFGDTANLHRQAQDDFYRSLQQRAGGFDADISALRSVSMVNKQRRQRERDAEMQSLLDHVRMKLWG